MNFCIATINYWHSVGFGTSDWRHSTDGLKAICHEKFSQALVEVENNSNVKTYNIDSNEFKAIIADEFTEIEE